jgi:hypothetical protein
VFNWGDEVVVIPKVLSISASVLGAWFVDEADQQVATPGTKYIFCHESCRCRVRRGDTELAG